MNVRKLLDRCHPVRDAIERGVSLGYRAARTLQVTRERLSGQSRDFVARGRILPEGRERHWRAAPAPARRARAGRSVYALSLDGADAATHDMLHCSIPRSSPVETETS